MTIPKPWYLSRTLWLNAIAFTVMLLTLPELGALVPASWRPIIGVLVAAGNMALRFSTAQPLSTPAGVAEAEVRARALRAAPSRDGAP
jgi:hypothetical protein